jgi:spore germination cell wall hydrolase CwlJ-like protein
MTSQELLDDIISLALNIYFEARGESRVGQLAVALVTMNRVDDPRWPNTVKGVVWQDTKPGQVGGEQFSWTAEFKDQEEALSEVRGIEAFERALSVALEVWKGIEDFTDGANLYHARYVSPFWRHHPRVYKKAEIGQHIFYKEVE